MTRKIRVLVVDDSAFMRKSISIMVEGDDIEVVATARDGLEGFELARSLRPDIVTMDIEMPRMDGLTSLKKIMQNCPVPVLMISSLTTEGAESTMKALEYGAVDFIPKELSYVNVNIIKIKEELIQKIKGIVRQRALNERLRKLRALQRKSAPEQRQLHVQAQLPKLGYKAVALGISTGGPISLQKVVPKLSGSISIPIFIVQHMPPRFTKSLADRLNSMSRLEVREASDNEEVKNGTVYIAPGGFHMKLVKKLNGQVITQITENPSDTLHRPSVDVMTSSVIDVYGKNTLGIIMTGMGKDGLEGIKKLKSLGGVCLIQDEESCVVYGMPKAIADAGLSDVSAPLDKFSEILNKVL